MAASTSNKVALLAAAAKDDINNLTLTSLDGNLAVLANDPGAAKLWSVFTNAGTMLNGSTPVSSVAHVTTATTAAGGTVTINADGSLSYHAPASITAAQFTAAAEGDLVLTDSFSYVAQMANGAMSLANVVFSIRGVNDVAQIGGDDDGSVVEQTQPVDTGVLTIVDPDHDQSAFVATTYTDGYGALDMASGGAWTYTLQTHSLWGGETATDTVVVKSVDGTEHTVTIHITGTNDAATFTGDDAGAVTEDTSPNASGTLVAADLDHDQSSMQASSADGTYGGFAIDEQGNWTYALGDAAQALRGGEQQSETFTVHSFDGTAHDIVVNITGTNDDATISGSDSGSVTEDTAPDAIGGQLAVGDVDHGENTFQAVDAAALNGTYGTFSFDAGTGDWTYQLDNSRAAVQGLNTGDVQYDSLVVTSLDGTATDTIVVTVNGLDEPAPPAPPAEFLINYGKDVSDHNVFTGFGSANTLEYTPNLHYTGATQVDLDNNGSLESTLVSFTFTAGPNVTVVDAVLVGYSGFTDAQLQVVG
jgi:VCBS repeat-containing protein